MRTKGKQLFVTMAAALAVLSSCNKNVFDPDEYKNIMNQESPVGDIDSTQTWRTTQQYAISVSANAPDVDAQQVLILSPNQGNSYEVLSQVYVNNGQAVSVNFSAPIITEQLYAAIYDGQSYTLQPFTAGQTSVDFNNTLPEFSGRNLSLTQQGYTYCFEDAMPEPSDYDYNDLVLRVVKERTGERELKLNVTLAAIGSTMPMGAAIHLANIKFTDIESVTTHGSRYQFVENYPLDRIYLEKKDTLQEARNGEAVIALFEDAHWALDGRNLPSNYELITSRYTYNTLRVNSETAKQRTPRTVTYTITFKSSNILDRLVMDDIDPFMLKDYNGGIWEVHIPAYETAQVLWDYKLPDNVTIMPWAVSAPTSVFRYPLEEKVIGKYKNNVISGAYMEIGHSFGQWAANKETSKDWYLHPTNGQVY